LREERRLRLFENSVLRKIFGYKGERVTVEYRKIHNEELYVLYLSPNVTGMIKSRMRWAGCVACMGRGEVHRGSWWGNLRKRVHLEDTGVDGKIIHR
jgi:hypothetical protein